MNILLKSCTIIDPKGPFHLKVKDIYIEGETIHSIEDKITLKADKVVELPNLHVSFGWYDAKVNFQDPGNEIKENLSTGLTAAALGGMTAVSVTPMTNPTLSNKTQIEYVRKKGEYSPVEIYPYGTLTELGEGKNIAEYYDMSQSGAVGFTDGHQPVNAGIMYRALLYMKNVNSKVVSFPYDYSIFGEGQVNESKASVLTGLKSIPNIAEYLMVERDLSLTAYTDSTIHFTGISTKESVDLIRKAKKSGLNVTADVYAHHLAFTDKEVLGFDSNFKVLPPLRQEKDRQALIKGLKDGTLDFICSDHTPEDKENKDLEFDFAHFGMIGTQTLFATLNEVKGLDLSEKINAISIRPRKVMKLPYAPIASNSMANLTLFDPSMEYTLNADDLASLSKNTPLLGKKLRGKALGVINNGIISIFED